VIYFPQDGPQAAKTTLKERVAWVKGSDVKVVSVGPDGQRDNLAKWLLGRNVLTARPRVIYNHLKVRTQIDKAMGTPNVLLKGSGDDDAAADVGDNEKDIDGLPTIAAIEILLGTSLENDLVQAARFRRHCQRRR
jgi:hypothetical protein